MWPEDEVVAMTLSKNPEEELLTVLANGLGKRTRIGRYRRTRRGSHGVHTTDMKRAKSRIVTALVVREDDQLLVTTKNGIVIRCSVKGIRLTGRAAKGVRIQKLEDGDRVMAVAHLVGEREVEEAIEAVEDAGPGPLRPQPEIPGPGEPEGPDDGEPDDGGDEPEEL